MKPVILSVLVFLVACSSSPCVVYQIECPPQMDYTQQSQLKLAKELESLKPDSEIMRYLLDYKRQQDMLKACQDTQNPHHHR